MPQKLCRLHNVFDTTDSLYSKNRTNAVIAFVDSYNVDKVKAMK